MNEVIKEKERLELQRQQEFEENEEKMRQEAIKLLSEEMKKEYESKMKKLELNENGGKRKWAADDTNSVINDMIDNHQRNYNISNDSSNLNHSNSL
eukprot:jgi/Orpsp1_1/1175787/evm.model.c7180000055197.1